MFFSARGRCKWVRGSLAIQLSLFSSSPGSLICFIFCPLMWLEVKWLGFQRRERFPLDLQPKPQTSSRGFLALHHIIVNGTWHVFAIILCNFTGKGSCLKVRPGVPHPQCLTWHTVWALSSQIFVELRELEVSVICEELKFLVKVTLVSTI